MTVFAQIVKTAGSRTRINLSRSDHRSRFEEFKREARPHRAESPCLGVSVQDSPVSAIILWDTRSLQAALADLGQRGTDVRPMLARHVAPLGWKHIGLTGDYVWDVDPMPADGLRPLRRATSVLAASFLVRSRERYTMITFVSSPHLGFTCEPTSLHPPPSIP